MAAVSIFARMLADVLHDKGVPTVRWHGSRRPSDHLIQLETGGKSTVLYVKESNTWNRGFWGLTKNRVECLEAAGVRWFAVLLRESSESGYLLSGGQVHLRVHEGLFELSRDGDFKINERPDLDSQQKFTGLSQLIARVL